MRKTNLFTLLELLVTIAVIAVLASLLLPALGKAKATALRITCSNQLKQMGVGIYNYVDDYGGNLPYLRDQAPYGEKFLNKLPTRPDTKTPVQYFPMGLLDCPGDQTRTSEVDYWPYYGAYSVNLSYGYNCHLIAGDNNSPYYKPRQISLLRLPSQDAMMFEVSRDMGCNTSAQISHIAGNSAFLNEMHHGNGNNFLFVDGHVLFYAFNDYLNSLRNEGDTYYNPNWGTKSLNYMP